MEAARTRVAVVLLIVQGLVIVGVIAALLAQLFFSYPDKMVMGWLMCVGLAAAFGAYGLLAGNRDNGNDDRELYAVVVDICFLLVAAVGVAFEAGHVYSRAWLGVVVIVVLWVFAYFLSGVANSVNAKLHYAAIGCLLVGLMCGANQLSVYAWFATDHYTWATYLAGLLPATVYALLVWRRFFRQLMSA